METIVNIITMFFVAIILGVGIRIGESIFDKIKYKLTKTLDTNK